MRVSGACWFSLDLGNGSFIGQLESVLSMVTRAYIYNTIAHACVRDPLCSGGCTCMSAPFSIG